MVCDKGEDSGDSQTCWRVQMEERLFVCDTDTSAFFTCPPRY